MQTLNHGIKAKVTRTAQGGAGQRLEVSSLLWWRGGWWRVIPPAVPFASAWVRDS